MQKKTAETNKMQLTELPGVHSFKLVWGRSKRRRSLRSASARPAGATVRRISPPLPEPLGGWEWGSVPVSGRGTCPVASGRYLFCKRNYSFSRYYSFSRHYCSSRNYVFSRFYGFSRHYSFSRKVASAETMASAEIIVSAEIIAVML